MGFIRVFIKGRTWVGTFPLVNKARAIFHTAPTQHNVFNIMNKDSGFSSFFETPIRPCSMHGSGISVKVAIHKIHNFFLFVQRSIKKLRFK